jgi:3-hydroxyisobutyrate dehydrogenase-like beta-hydroxyacid dehydrogenase
MIVVVGLGNIGLAIAERIAGCGKEVCGVDLAEDRRAEWKRRTGLDAVADLTAVPWGAVTHVFVLVRLTYQARSVLGQLDELPIRPGTAVFLTTTVELEYARTLDRYEGRTWRLVELPVSGGESGARAGTLTVLAARALDDTDRELLHDTIAANIVMFRQWGEPTLAKLLNNVSAAYTALAYAEMLLLAERTGMDPRRLAEVLHTSSGGSWMGDHFTVLVDDLLDKDVALLRSEFGELPVVSLAADRDLVGRLGQARALLRDDGWDG